MRIGGQIFAQGLVANLVTPYLCPAVEDALIASHAVQHRSGLAVQAAVIGGMRQHQTAQIGDVLAHRQFRIDGDAFQRLLSGVERTQLGGLGLEARGVFGGPPVTQLAFGVGLAALVVETVHDFVADHGTDTAIVHCRISIRIEEGRLQDGSGEDDLVAQRMIIGVHRLRRHAPFFQINGLADLGAGIVPVKGRDALQIAVQVLGLDLETIIRAPFGRIADLGTEAFQLGQRLGAGRRCHPFQIGQAVAHFGDQIADQLFHLGLGLSREVAGDVFLTQHFGQRAVDQSHATVPARTVLGLTTQGLVAELEAGIDELFRQIGGGTVGDVERLPCLKRLQIGFAKHLGHAGQGGVFHHDDLLHIADLSGVQHGGPVKARRIGVQVCGGDRVVQLVELATLGDRPVLLGDLGLEGQNVGGGLGRVVPADQRQHALDIGLVGLALGGEIVGAVVFAFRQAQSPDTDIQRVHRRVLHVLHDVEAEDAAAEAGLGGPHQAGDVAVAGAGANLGQILGHRLGTQLFQHGLVHEAGVQGTDLAGVVRGRIGGRLFDDGTQLALGIFIKHVERAVAGLVRRDFDAFQIFAIGVGVEVVARADARVSAVEVKAPGLEVGRLRMGGAGSSDTGRQGDGAHQVLLHGGVLYCLRHGLTA